MGLDLCPSTAFRDAVASMLDGLPARTGLGTWMLLRLRPDGGSSVLAVRDRTYGIEADRDKAIAAWTITLPAKDAEIILDKAEVPCSRLYDIADCAADRHFLARQAVQSIDDPLIGRTAELQRAIEPAAQQAASIAEEEGRAKEELSRLMPSVL